VLDRLARVQPYLYAGAMSIAAMAMMEAGIAYGAPRRDPVTMSIPGTDFNFAAAEPLYALLGVSATVAVLAGAIFILVAVGSLLFGAEARMRTPVPLSLTGGDRPVHEYSMRGTMAAVLFFLFVFALFYAMDWMWLSRLWEFGT
jgi:cytochrome c oxidase subunit 1